MSVFNVGELDILDCQFHAQYVGYVSATFYVAGLVCCHSISNLKHKTIVPDVDDCRFKAAPVCRICFGNFVTCLGLYAVIQ